MSNHVQRGSGVNNTPEDDFIQINVSSTEFKNESQGGVIGGAVGSRLYLSQDGNVRLVQGTPLLGQQAPRLYDFDKGGWTPLGEELISDENDRTNLLNATKIELQNEISRRKKSGVDQKGVDIGADSIVDASGVQDRDKKEEELEKKEDDNKTGNEKSKDKEANIYDLQSQLKKLQKTDSILQRLSLRNLKYPIDADYGNTQDYVQIDQFTYQAVNPSIIFPQKKGDEGAFAAGGREASNTILNGLDRTSPKNITIL